MGLEKINRVFLKKAVIKEVGNRTNVNIYTKRGILNVEIPVKPHVTLSSVLNAVDAVYRYAEAKQNPTVLSIKTEDKRGSEITLSFPIATMGVKGGKPLYPYYEPAGRALHIASKYPRNTSPNMREIAGQYALIYEAKKEFGTDGAKSSAYPNVEVSIKTAGGVKCGTDIDLLYFTKGAKSDTYHVVLTEVTTSIDSIERKIKCWVPKADLVRTLAEAEGFKANVVPAVVYIQKTYNGGAPESSDWAGEIDDVLRTYFPGHRRKIITLRSSTGVKNSKCFYRRMDQVEYINAALRNYALLPKKYHSPLTHHTLKNYRNVPKLAELFHESAALRKIWLCQQIPYHLKDALTNTYRKKLKKCRSHALLHAFDELSLPAHAGRHQEIYTKLDSILHQMVKRFDPSEYKKI